MTGDPIFGSPVFMRTCSTSSELQPLFYLALCKLFGDNSRFATRIRLAALFVFVFVLPFAFLIVPPLLDNGGLESSLRSHNRQSEPDTRQQAGVAICLTTATVSGSLRRLLFASLKIRF